MPAKTPALPDVTLLFLLRDKEVLLAMKKRRFGEGRWNGVGGKLEPGESITEGLVRETREEIGVDINPSDLTQVAEIDFYFPPGPKSAYNQRVHTFVIHKWQGDPTETEEMRPEWFHRDNLPFDTMWDGDDHWIPLALNSRFVTGTMYFNNDEHFDRAELTNRPL